MVSHTATALALSTVNLVCGFEAEAALVLHAIRIDLRGASCATFGEVGGVDGLLALRPHCCERRICFHIGVPPKGGRSRVGSFSENLLFDHVNKRGHHAAAAQHALARHHSALWQEADQSQELVNHVAQDVTHGATEQMRNG